MIKKTSAFLEARYELEIYNLLSKKSKNWLTFTEQLFNENSYLSIDEQALRTKSTFEILRDSKILTFLLSLLIVYAAIAYYICIVKPVKKLINHYKILHKKNEYKKAFLEELKILNEKDCVIPVEDLIITRPNDLQSISSSKKSLEVFDLDEKADLYGYFCAYLLIRHNCKVIPNGRIFLDWLELVDSKNAYVKAKKKSKKLIYSY